MVVIAVCDGCNKSEDRHMMKCSGCKDATYCCRDCQVRHWPAHKTYCKQVQQTKKEMKDKDSKRECRMWRRWIDIAPIFDLVVYHFGVSQVEAFHGKMGIILDTAFDYNRQTFVPTRPPYLMPLIMIQQAGSLEQSIVKPGHLLIQIEYTDDKGRKALKLTRYSPLTLLSDILTIPSYSWEERVERAFPHNVPSPLQSSIFDSWVPLRNENLEQQVKLIRDSPHYNSFLLNALHIETAKPRHKTHVVMVYLKLGFGLGQIAELPKYQVLTLKEANHCIQEKFKSVPATAAEYCKSWLDLETSPDVVAARQKKPNSFRVPVLFHIPTFIFMRPVMGVLNYESFYEIVSAAMSDTKTLECFAELNKISFPTVMSPKLH